MGQYISVCFVKESLDVANESPAAPQHRTASTFMDASSYSPYDTVMVGNNYAGLQEDIPYMTNPQRRLAIIFNHEYFDPSLQVYRRVGTQIDLGELSKVLKELKFEINVYQDLSYAEIKERLQKVSEKEEEDCDCLMVVVMTHGSENGRLYAKDRVYFSRALWSPFTGDKCTSLVGKPKFFIIQACRGASQDFGIMVPQRIESECITDGSDDISIPVMADIFIAYSSCEGYVSWRERTKGSWFIQELCKCLRSYHNSLDFQRIMTRVCLRVATDYESHPSIISEFNKMKQMPNIHSTLRYDVYFY